MKKSDLLKLVENLKDDDSVLEVLKGAEGIQSMINNSVTLDLVKGKFLSDEKFKKYLDDSNKAYSNIAIEAWKKNNLQGLIDDAVLKATGKKKTPEELRIEELERKFAESEKKAAEVALNSQAKDMLVEKGLKPELIGYLNLGDSAETIKTNISNIHTYIQDMVNEGVKNAVAEGSYTPPGQDDSSDTVLSEIESIMMGM